MKLRERIPVEPLDDERLTNIERKLVVRVSEMAAPPARASRRVLAFAGVAFAVGAAAGIGWKLHTPAVVPPAAEVAQTFTIEATDTRQAVKLDDATITSAPDTRVAVSHTSHETVITMVRGTLDLVGHASRRSPLRDPRRRYRHRGCRHRVLGALRWRVARRRARPRRRGRRDAAAAARARRGRSRVVVRCRPRRDRGSAGGRACAGRAGSCARCHAARAHRERAAVASASCRRAGAAR